MTTRQVYEFRCYESFTYEGCEFKAEEIYTVQYAGYDHSERCFDVQGRDGNWYRMCHHKFQDHFDITPDGLYATCMGEKGQ